MACRLPVYHIDAQLNWLLTIKNQAEITQTSVFEDFWWTDDHPNHGLLHWQWHPNFHDLENRGLEMDKETDQCPFSPWRKAGEVQQKPKWVCLKIVYLIFQWIITMFLIKIAMNVGIPYFQTNPSVDEDGTEWFVYGLGVSRWAGYQTTKPLLCHCFGG